MDSLRRNIPTCGSNLCGGSHEQVHYSTQVPEVQLMFWINTATNEKGLELVLLLLIPGPTDPIDPAARTVVDYEPHCLALAWLVGWPGGCMLHVAVGRKAMKHYFRW